MPSGKKKTKPKLPRKLDIFSTTWKIKYSNSPYDVGDARNSTEPAFGQCNYIDRVMEIYAGDRQPADIWKTIIHEVLHAVANELGLTELEDAETCESIIDRLSTGIVDVFVRNKLVIEV